MCVNSLKLITEGLVEEREDLLTAPTFHRGETVCFCSSLITAHYPGIRLGTAVLAVNKAVSLACAGGVYINTKYTTHLNLNGILIPSHDMQVVCVHNSSRFPEQ